MNFKITERVDILCQPNVPKTLHGLNPRIFKTYEEWEKYYN